MLDSKTCFVVGAGASHELNLPTGATLTRVIASTIAPNRKDPSYFSEPLRSALVKACQDRGDQDIIGRLSFYAGLADQLADAMPLAPSIDNFLHTHRDKPEMIELGKIGIALSILRAERTSHLYEVGSHRDFVLPQKAELENSWLFRSSGWSLRGGQSRIYGNHCPA